MKHFRPAKISLKDYLDYREYLRDSIAFRREYGENITNRSFAASLGIQSSSWLTTVLNGQKGIRDETIDAINVFLGHDEWERAYFKILVDFNQAKTIERRNAFFSDLKTHLLKKGYYAIKVLDTDQYEFYSKWYYTAVRSILGMEKIGEEYERIAKLVSPSISASQAKRSVHLLIKLGLVQKGSEGFFELTNRAISTGQNVRSLAVANFQREMIRLGSDAIDAYDAACRDISTMSVGVSQEGFKKIVNLLSVCRKSIADIANSDQNADRVYQINLQAFPLSKIISKEDAGNEN